MLVISEICRLENIVLYFVTRSNDQNEIMHNAAELDRFLASGSVAATPNTSPLCEEPLRLVMASLLILFIL